MQNVTLWPIILILFLLLGAEGPANADAEKNGGFFGNVAINGELATEIRLFHQDGRYDDQLSSFQLSGYLEPRLRWRSAGREDTAQFIPYFRLDAVDGRRSHVDTREAYWRHVAGHWEFLIGVNRVFWGVTESRHLVNVINQIDGVEDTDEEDYFGQPMVQVGYQAEIGRFDVFLMTGFRERSFAGRKGRFRNANVVDTSEAGYDNKLAQWYPEGALRYSHYIGAFDVGLHAFHGTGREPYLVADTESDRMVPRYTLISQVGADLQYTTDEWLWKFEGLVREGQGSLFAAVVAGFEYTLFQVSESDAELGLLAEILFDDRDEDVFSTALDKDLFLGARFAYNDMQDTSALVGLFLDIEDGPGGLKIEAERRFSPFWPKITR